MKSITVLVLSFMLAFSLSSCGQKTTKDDSAKSNQATETTPTKSQDLSKYKQATFAQGCFWCMEGMYESVNGVQEAISGYAGGNTENPTYEEVETGTTGHAESFTVYYDSAVVDYPTLLQVYFAAGDPTQVNGQGPDIGSQYRSIIFYRTQKEKQEAEQAIDELNKSGKYQKPIAVEVVPFTKFWPAEDYHQDYVQKHPDDNDYVNHVSIPKIRHFQSTFPQLVKPDRKLK